MLYAGGVVLAAALLSLAPLVGSNSVALGAGVASGGAVATVVCGIAWRGGVPNPLVAGSLAFNAADVAIAGGVALLVGGAVLNGWRHRDELGRPVRPG